MNIDKSRLKAKMALEKLYEDTCNIYTYEKITDVNTGITRQIKKFILKMFLVECLFLIFLVQQMMSKLNLHKVLNYFYLPIY